MKANLVLLAILSLTGCGGGSSKNASDLDIVGAWGIPCALEELFLNNEESAFVVRTLTFETVFWSSTTDAFSDESCQTSILATSRNGTFAIGENVITSEGITVRSLSLSELDDEGNVPNIEDGVYYIENDILYFGTFDEVTGIPTLEFGRVWEKQ